MKDFKVPIVTIQVTDWIAKRKKFKLNIPDKTNLLVNVIKIDEAQYEKIDIGAELTTDEDPEYDDILRFFK